MPVRVLHVVGTRPNFMKVAPVMHAMSGAPEFEQFLVHTGQHYDASLSDVFLDELDLPAPFANLGVGSGTQAKQTAEAMTRIDDVLSELRPDWVVVPGDVNSTLAAALAAAKRGTPVAHLEAGLRSRDRSMPEEVNRVVVDRIAQLLLTPSRDADANLLAEGSAPDTIRFVGNVMIDTLSRLLPRAQERWQSLRDRFDVDRYVVVTLHRPSNVDEPIMLDRIHSALEEIAQKIDVVFPMHPRTRDRAGSAWRASPRLHIVEPLGYLDFLALEANAALVLTDSGGVQEETTWLDVPCLTLRTTTERPITITDGTNSLVALDSASSIVGAVDQALRDPAHRTAPPELWDGHAAERVVTALAEAAGLG